MPLFCASTFTIFQLSIMHSVCPPNFAKTIVVKYSWEVCIFPRAFRKNSLCKIWGANGVHYGQLENREWPSYHVIENHLLSYQENQFVRCTDLKKRLDRATCCLHAPKCEARLFLIAAILVRPLNAPQLWICGLKIMNLKHTNL